MNILKRIKWKLQALAKHFRTPLENLPQSPDYFRMYRFFVSEKEFERFPGGWIYKGQKYPDYLFMGGAGVAIFRVAQKFIEGKGIDIGAGYWEFPGSTPIDPGRGAGKETPIESVAKDSLDYVFSSHTLEHIVEWELSLAQWVSLLKKGGRMFLYLPHPDCLIWRRGAPGIGDGHKWIPSASKVVEELERQGLTIVARDDGPDGMMSFFVCAEK
jgi:SAM-dependent methyltransferase